MKNLKLLIIALLLITVALFTVSFAQSPVPDNNVSENESFYRKAIDNSFAKYERLKAEYYSSKLPKEQKKDNIQAAIDEMTTVELFIKVATTEFGGKIRPAFKKYLEEKLKESQTNISPLKIFNDYSGFISESDLKQYEGLFKSEDMEKPLELKAIKSDNADCKIIEAGRGCGEIKIGATRNQIESLIGKTEAGDDEYATYYEKGLVVNYDSAQRVEVIRFIGDAANYSNGKTKFRSFAGKPDKNLSWGASRQQVIAAYGTPVKNDSFQNVAEVIYNDIEFNFQNDRLTVIAVKKGATENQDDDDGDGVKNSDDVCPQDKGTKANKGCPEKTATAIKTAKELNPNNEGGDLFYAIKNGNDALAESLMKNGANLHYVAENGESTLVMTIRDGSYSYYYTKKLLEMGADPNFVGDGQHSPLARAVIEGKLEIVKLLVDKYKADINIIRFSWSILHYAATYNQNGEITQFLLAAGANPNISIDGKTPLSIALESRNSPAIINLLTEASNNQIKSEAQKRDQTVGAENRKKDAEIEAEQERERKIAQAKRMTTESGASEVHQNALARQGYQYVASGTTTLQGRNSNDKNQAVKQGIVVGYQYIFVIVTKEQIGWVVTIGDDGKFTSSNKPSEGFGKEKVPNSDLTSYFFKFVYDDKSGYVYFIPHGESWADVRWVLMRKKL